MASDSAWLGMRPTVAPAVESYRANPNSRFRQIDWAAIYRAFMRYCKASRFVRDLCYERSRKERYSHPSRKAGIVMPPSLRQLAAMVQPVYWLGIETRAPEDLPVRAHGSFS